MSPTVHKILIHGASIIKHHLIPIGELSEEALESNHKVCKKVRLNLTRKTSILDTNTDMVNRLILRSDPVLLSKRNPKSYKKKKLPLEVKELLQDTESDTDDSDDSDNHE